MTDGTLKIWKRPSALDQSTFHVIHTGLVCVCQKTFFVDPSPTDKPTADSTFFFRNIFATSPTATFGEPVHFSTEICRKRADRKFSVIRGCRNGTCISALCLSCYGVSVAVVLPSLHQVVLTVIVLPSVTEF